MQSPANKPQKSYIICATARCGSHFLANALQNTELAGKPDEYFQANKTGQLQNETGVIADIYGKKSLEDFRDLVLGFGSSSNNVFGIIIHWSYLHDVIRQYGSLPQHEGLTPSALFDSIFYQPKYIWIKRRNKLRQAISWYKAKQTNIWHKPKKQEAKPSFVKKDLNYDYYEIDFLCYRFVEEEKGWASFFKENNIEPFIVVYEDFVGNYEQTLRQLLIFLDIPYPNDLQFKGVTLQKQADDLTEKWINKYLHQKKSTLHTFIRFARFLWLRFYRKTPVSFQTVSRTHYS